MIYIETERLILRPLCIKDAESMFAYACDPEITKYVTWFPHQSIEDSKVFIHKVIAGQQNAPLDSLAITFKTNPDAIIGVVGIRNSTLNPYEGALSYGLARKYWKQGIMFEACSALVDRAFKDFNYKRIYAFCRKENIASQSLMKKLGMIFEGCLRSHLYCKERLWDIMYYAILENEWQAQKSSSLDQKENEYPITFVSKPSLEDIEVLNTGLSAYAKQKKDLDSIESFAFFVKNKKGQILAGCNGDIIYGCLYTGTLWVSENFRRQGIGTRLLQAAEQLAREKDCAMATINTMDWEALDFYQSLGYTVDLARKGYKNNSTFYFLKKDLS